MLELHGQDQSFQLSSTDVSTSDREHFVANTDEKPPPEKASHSSSKVSSITAGKEVMEKYMQKDDLPVTTHACKHGCHLEITQSLQLDSFPFELPWEPKLISTAPLLLSLKTKATACLLPFQILFIGSQCLGGLK